MDHFFVTDKIKQTIVNYEIIDSGINLSDHLPVSCTISISPLEVCKDLHHKKKIYRDRWDKADLALYYNLTGQFLQTIYTPYEILEQPAIATDINGNLLYACAIESYYKSIVNALQNASNYAVPKIPVKCLKEYWSEDISKLKEISLDMHKLWKSLGSPRDSVINTARLKAKLDYKKH